MISFNLIDEPWIPVLLTNDATQSFGLADTFARASEIREIADPSPLNVVGIHRLLLAIAHRVFGPASMEAWSDIWHRGSFDEAVIRSYLETWRKRFELFDEQQPFYQVGSLDVSYAKTIAGLAHELAGKAGAELFNHGLADSDEVSAAMAARMLVAHQYFAVGGLVSLQKGEDTATFKSADAAPLTKGAIVTVKGQSLFETLLYNLHQYDRKAEQPFPFLGVDRPCWERDEPTTAADRGPDGYIDLLTWQSRRIRLFPSLTSSGDIVVRLVAIMKGYQFPGGYTRHGRETMLVFRAAKDLKTATDPWPAISFREDRAFWRDSLALIQSADGERERPKVITWLNELAGAEYISPDLTLPLDVAGLAVDRAKVFFWRHERLPLPLAYLGNKDLLDELKRALAAAEAVGAELRSSSWVLATLLVSPNSGEPGGRDPLKADVQKIMDNLALERAYWPRLESPFLVLLTELPQDEDEGEYGVIQRKIWATALRRSARDAFARVALSLDGSARTLKAVSHAERNLDLGLAKALRNYATQDQPAENNV